MSSKRESRKSIPARIHYATMIALVITNVSALGVAMVFAADYGQGIGYTSYAIESSGSAVVPHAYASARLVTGRTALQTSCPGNVGVIDGSGRGTATISNATVFISLNQADQTGAPYNGLIVVNGFTSDYQTQTVRVLEGSGTLTFNGRNRIVIIGDSSVGLSGNYHYRYTAAPASCPPVSAIEPTP